MVNTGFREQTDFGGTSSEKQKQKRGEWKKNARPWVGLNHQPFG